MLAAALIVGGILAALWQSGLIFQSAPTGEVGAVRSADANVDTPSVAGAGVGVRAGDVAPNFEASALDGSRFRLSDFRGRPVFINFWATWCGPCRVELPDIQTTLKNFSGQGLVVISINNGETAKAARRYLNDLDVDLTVLAVDPGSDIAQRYRAEGMPTSVFIDADGVVTRYHAGQISLNVMQSAAREAIAGAASLKGSAN